MLSIATILSALKSIALALGVTVANAIFQVVRNYTLPNIGYYKRRHGHEYTFFVRNLDSVEYRKPLKLSVSGKDLQYVSVQAGPWCTAPLKATTTESRTTVTVVFDAVPEDAVFIIRSQAPMGDVSLAIDPSSALVSRHSFETELPAFRGIAHYYMSRYVIGVFVFLTVFLGSIILTDPRRYHAIDVGDITVVLLALVVSVLAFALVVPYRGKRTIGGYESGASIGVCWPNEDAVRCVQDNGLLPPRRATVTTA